MFDEIETEKDIPDLFSVILIVTMLANFVLEFLFSKYVIYKNQENTRA